MYLGGVSLLFVIVKTQETGATTPFARAVTAEVRSLMGAHNITGRSLSERIPGRSNNYVAERLRDEKPFSVDDLAAIAAAFGVTPAQLVTDAMRWMALDEASGADERPVGVSRARVAGRGPKASPRTSADVTPGA